MHRGLHLGAAGGPLSLLLMPKCPLCLMPLLATLGITAVPTSRMLFLAAAALCAIWLAIMFVMRRLQFAAVVIAAAGVVAVFMQSTIALSACALGMASVGLLASRACTGDTCSSLDTATPRA